MGTTSRLVRRRVTLCSLVRWHFLCKFTQQSTQSWSGATLGEKRRIRTGFESTLLMMMPMFVAVARSSFAFSANFLSIQPTHSTEDGEISHSLMGEKTENEHRVRELLHLHANALLTSLTVESRAEQQQKCTQKESTFVMLKFIGDMCRRL